MAQPHPGGQGLDGELPDAAGIAQGAQSRGAAHRDVAALVARLLQRRSDPVHLGVDVVIGVGVQQTHLRAEDVVQHQVAPVLRDAPPLQQQDALHPQPCSAGGGEGRVVGLGAAGGEHRVAPLVQSLRQQEFQLADLVAPQGHAAQVVPLDPDAAAVLLAQFIQPVERRGIDAQRDSGQILNALHAMPPVLLSPAAPRCGRGCRRPCTRRCRPPARWHRRRCRSCR